MRVKMRGRYKKFGRCSTEGHQECEVTLDIREPYSRNMENVQYDKIMRDGIDEYYADDLEAA